MEILIYVADFLVLMKVVLFTSYIKQRSGLSFDLPFFSATRNFLRMQTFMKYAAQQLLSSEIQKVVDIFKNRVEISEHFNCLNIMQY